MRYTLTDQLPTLMAGACLVVILAGAGLAGYVVVSVVVNIIAYFRDGPGDTRWEQGQ